MDAQYVTAVWFTLVFGVALVPVLIDIYRLLNRRTQQ